MNSLEESMNDMINDQRKLIASLRRQIDDLNEVIDIQRGIMKRHGIT